MMINIKNKLTLYQWLMAGLSIVSIFLIILDFAAVISIDQPSSKWFWVNSVIVVFFAIDYFHQLYEAKNKKQFFKTHIYDLLSIIPIVLFQLAFCLWDSMFLIYLV
ncbi:hypothetical protein FC94_GL000979 [Lactobacillus kefiranofaciens subsp. kefirgranum DSM 10550 = JCM 8572]|nr:hypothetical protein FC94_GL000979 [Lactobacillus kefiranofaciens subsp. kefirgranum DSM 10550 = JCM 8572]